MNDRFGEVMLNNLRSRRCSLAGVDACQTLDTQIERFFFSLFLFVFFASNSSGNFCIYMACFIQFRYIKCGWHGAKAWDMVQVYESISKAERQRIEKLEMLDEGELLTQLFQHYCLSIAWTGVLFKDIEIT